MGICRARLTNCQGALTKCQNVTWNRWDFRSFFESIGVNSELNAGLILNIKAKHNTRKHASEGHRTSGSSGILVHLPAASAGTKLYCLVTEIAGCKKLIWCFTQRHFGPTTNSCQSTRTLFNTLPCYRQRHPMLKGSTKIRCDSYLSLMLWNVTVLCNDHVSSAIGSVHSSTYGRFYRGRQGWPWSLKLSWPNGPRLFKV